MVIDRESNSSIAADIFHETILSGNSPAQCMNIDEFDSLNFNI